MIVRSFVIGLLLLSACASDLVALPIVSTDHPAPWDPDSTYVPGIASTELSSPFDNAFFPSAVGTRRTYEGITHDGVERIEVEVLAETREVWGTSAVVIRDTVYIDDELSEDTWDWFAGDGEGNVWYLGEDSSYYEADGTIRDGGSWEAGVEDALPGIQMFASPRVGDAYRLEYKARLAEDIAEIVAVDVSVTIAAGSWSGCVRIREMNAIERDVEEFKTVCPGIGLVLEEVPADGERIELIAFTDPG